MHIDFTKPTILTLQQYGTKVTIELDHSDTDIRELFDAFKAAVIGQGYLMSTIEGYVKDWAEEIKESDKDTISYYLEKELDDWQNFQDNKPHFDWDDVTIDEDDFVWGSEEEEEDDLDIMMRESGFATDEDIEECEINDELANNNELQSKGYKGIHVEKPNFESDNFEDYQNDMSDNELSDSDVNEVNDEEVIWDWDEPNEKLKEAGKQYQKKMKATSKKTKRGKK